MSSSLKQQTASRRNVKKGLRAFLITGKPRSGKKETKGFKQIEKSFTNMLRTVEDTTKGNPFVCHVEKHKKKSFTANCSVIFTVHYTQGRTLNALHKKVLSSHVVYLPDLFWLFFGNVVQTEQTCRVIAVHINFLIYYCNSGNQKLKLGNLLM